LPGSGTNRTEAKGGATAALAAWLRGWNCQFDALCSIGAKEFAIGAATPRAEQEFYAL
jgi:hypothetical protein